MKALVQLFAALALLAVALPALAHGDERHGETPAAHGEKGHDMATMSADGSSNGAPTDHGTEQVRSEGFAGVLKSLHPATVHFPIALFLMAALTELFVMARRTPDREAAVRIMIYGGAAGALLAALFGWIHTGLWFGGDVTMQAHRWTGMLIALLGAAAAWLAHRQSVSRAALRIVLFSIAALLLAQGFLGGELAHGTNHLKL